MKTDTTKPGRTNTAGTLFFDGRLLRFCHIQHNRISSGLAEVFSWRYIFSDTTLEVRTCVEENVLKLRERINPEIERPSEIRPKGNGWIAVFPAGLIPEQATTLKDKDGNFVFDSKGVAERVDAKRETDAEIKVECFHRNHKGVQIPFDGLYAATDQTTTPEAAPEELAPEYAFCRIGDMWQIVFEGREIEPVRHLTGMIYLNALLSRPGHDFSALELYQRVNPQPPEDVALPPGKTLDPEERSNYGTGGTPDLVLPRRARKAAATRKAELQEELKEATLDIESREDREDEIERLEKALACGGETWANGGPTFEPKEQKQPRQTVAARIDAAIDAIEEKQHGGNLAKHLRQGIRKGKTLVYLARSTWKT